MNIFATVASYEYPVHLTVSRQEARASGAWGQGRRHLTLHLILQAGLASPKMQLSHYAIITLASFPGLHAFVVCATNNSLRSFWANYFVLYCKRRMREGLEMRLGLRHDYSLRFVALGNLYFPLRFDGETCLLGPGKIPDEKWPLWCGWYKFCVWDWWGLPLLEVSASRKINHTVHDTRRSTNKTLRLYDALR